MPDKGEQQEAAVRLSQDLPAELWMHIFAFLPVCDLLAVAGVCSEWRLFSSHNHVWRQVCLAMQPGSLCARYTAHLTAVEREGEDRPSYKRALMRRCRRDQRWRTGQYVGIKMRNYRSRDSSVRGVAVSPKNKDFFSVAAYDGLPRIYRNGTLCYEAQDADWNARFNSTRWSCNGTKVAFGCHTHNLFVLDSETMKLCQTYKKCFFGGFDRAPLEAHPEDANLLIGAGLDNQTLQVFDLRQDKPARQWTSHQGRVRDVCFVEGSSFGLSAKWVIASIAESSSTQLHISDFDAGLVRLQHHVPGGSGGFSVAIPPPYFGPSHNKMAYDQNRSLVVGMYGCAQVFHTHDLSHKATIQIPQIRKHYWKIRYNSNGTLMFIATDDSRVEIFERHPDGTHTALDEPLFVHSDDVEDCDIAPDDSYVVTASQDGSVGYIALDEECSQ